MANSAWAYATLELVDVEIFPCIQWATLSAIAQVTPGIPFGRIDEDVYHEVTRYSNHICQLTWSYSFTAKLEDTIADGFRRYLLEIG